jgi:hypothetical protein
MHRKEKRPGINELRTYLSANSMDLFEEFAYHLKREYDLSCAPAVYTMNYGWVFRFGRSNLYLIDKIKIIGDSFCIDDICVEDRDSLTAALKLADTLYAEGFGERLKIHSAQKSAAQYERTKSRLEREKKEIESMSSKINKNNFNKYRWSPKISRQKLKTLYENDAKMLQDEELIDDIGFALYARCLQGRDERVLIETGKVRCHNCGKILNYSKGLMECDCGYQYLFRDYMRSFRKNNMPSGSAQHIFNNFIEKWQCAQNYSVKMQIIDELVHEFHINLVTGVKGRFVGINLIEGTKKQIEELIVSLAYSNTYKDSKDNFMHNLKNDRVSK